MRTKILISWGIIDFRVNKVKYNSYKTRKGRFNYVYGVLNGYLSSMSDTIVSGVEIRNLSITHNNFYGLKDFHIINDLNYNCRNLLPLNENFVTIRMNEIDHVGIICGYGADLFFEIMNDNFYFNSCGYKIV